MRVSSKSMRPVTTVPATTTLAELRALAATTTVPTVTALTIATTVSAICATAGTRTKMFSDAKSRNRVQREAWSPTLHAANLDPTISEVVRDRRASSSPHETLGMVSFSSFLLYVHSNSVEEL